MGAAGTADMRFCAALAWTGAHTVRAATRRAPLASRRLDSEGHRIKIARSIP